MDDKCEYVDACVYSVDTWKNMLKEHDMLALTCFFLPPEKIWKEIVHFDFFVNLRYII
jgi:hypothetical protein